MESTEETELILQEILKTQQMYDEMDNYIIVKIVML